MGEPPAFVGAPYAFSVAEEVAIGGPVGTTLAADPDDGDSVANAITVADTTAFDLAATLGQRLTVEAAELSGGTATAWVTVALLTAKDTLRGTATLNWSADTVITYWDGVRLRGTPNQ